MADYPVERALAHLNKTGLQSKDPALYQTIKELINASRNGQTELGQTTTVINNNISSNANATYITSTDQTPVLPNSRQLLAGTNITFDDSITGERTVNCSGISSFSGTITDAQFKALPSTPILIGPIPSPGTRIKPISGTWIIDTLGGAYTNIDTADAWIVLTCGGYWMNVAIANYSIYTAPLTQFTDVFGAAQTRIYDMAFPGMDAITANASGDRGYTQYYSNANSPDITALDGAQLSIDVGNNVAGNFTGGNAANTIKYRVYYVIETL